MMTDIMTIIWKEFRELLIQRSGLRGGWIGLLILVGVFGIVFPLQSGSEWLTSPTTILMWSWVPFILVNSIVADSFAGERERHTLETLLASRLSDKAILIGKICSAIAYGWGITLVGVITGIITINVSNWTGMPQFFSPLNGLAIFLLSFLISWLAAGLGVLVSLRAASVRQAQQTLSFAFLFLFIPLMILPLLPENLRLIVANAVQGLDFQLLGIIIAVFLLAANLFLLILALRRFNRASLILANNP